MDAVPEVWSTLSSDDGDAIVVPEGTDPAVALAALVVEKYGGDDIEATHPVIVAMVADEGLKVEPWRQYSYEAAAAEFGIDPDDYLGWWGPGGSGTEVIYVLSPERSAYYIGELVDEHDAAGPLPEEKL